MPRLSALNHRDRLELGCPKMVPFTSQKHNWRSHLHCRMRHFLLPPSPTAFFFLLQRKMIARHAMFISGRLHGLVFKMTGPWGEIWEKFPSRHSSGNNRGNSKSLCLYDGKYNAAIFQMNRNFFYLQPF